MSLPSQPSYSRSSAFSGSSSPGLSNAWSQVVKTDKTRNLQFIIPAISNYLKNHPTETPATLELRLRGENCYTYLAASNESNPPGVIPQKPDGTRAKFTLWATIRDKTIAIAERNAIIQEYSHSKDQKFNERLNLINLVHAGILQTTPKDLHNIIKDRNQEYTYIPFDGLPMTILIGQMPLLLTEICLRLGKLKLAAAESIQSKVGSQNFKSELNLTQKWLVGVLKLIGRHHPQNEKEQEILVEANECCYSSIEQISIWLKDLDKHL